MIKLTPEQVEALLKPPRFELDLTTHCPFDSCYACASDCPSRCCNRPKFRVVSA